ncbi:SufD family Fe-S cluster assembly protein [Candidatus Gottesmanbacteria bacterium]|nr:SufD family Fe-S cluster assembly protein [Candidatus Gottesmanbacteria bacterium]
MKKIIQPKTIVVEIPEGESSYDYSVVGNGDLVLVFVAAGFHTASVYVRIRLQERFARAAIIGLVIGDKASTITIRTLQEHVAPDTTSDLLIKTVLSDHASCLYDGGIRVERCAQKTDAYQRNENMLLSGHAHAESKPSLEIFANDVRCTHGATVGPIPEEQLLYLSTRGIAHKNAQQLIVAGFLSHALEKISDLAVKNLVSDKIMYLVGQV